THFLVNKNIFDSKVWNMKEWIINYTQSLEDENYMVSYINKELAEQHKKEKELMFTKIKNTISNKMQVGKPFAVYGENIHGNIELISFYPVKDVHNKKNMAWLVSYEESSYIEEILRFKNVLIISTIIISILLFLIIYYLLNQKERLELEVKNKTKKLQDSQNSLKQLNKTLIERVDENVKELRKKDHLLLEQSKLAQMGEMLNMIAHQWRQPLNALSASTINLSLQNDFETLTKESIEEISSYIQKEAQKMSKTIDDFMEFNKSEENKKFNLNSAIDNTKEIVLPQLKNRSIELITQVDNDISVFHNEKALEHVLLNLITNARDAFDENKTIENKWIKIYSQIDEDKVMLKIEDNAGGIPQEIITKVFNPYFTTKEQGKGTGIGLYMSKQMIEAIDGSSIQVENSTDGAIFTIIFNLKK
ncbi:MAG: HAMP domain-containing histidine kinase, partial [Campylobacterales bacterium]|nr:HAMP domain-containing histidine kinase [Campylobacterales bacterium]